MIVLSILSWSVAIILLLCGIAVAIIAVADKRPSLAFFAVIPVALGIGRIVFGIAIAPPDHAVLAIAGLAAAALGIVAGNPITVAVLDFADRRGGTARSVDGEHGGIMVADAENGPSARREVLRGGTTIGYLERLVVVAAVAVGHWEIVAALIAIKGLGRYSELDSPETRERFIIGTLVSLVWAGACAALFAF
jgi:hypothetical protein